MATNGASAADPPVGEHAMDKELFHSMKRVSQLESQKLEGTKEYADLCAKLAGHASRVARIRAASVRHKPSQPVPAHDGSEIFKIEDMPLEVDSPEPAYAPPPAQDGSQKDEPASPAYFARLGLASIPRAFAGPPPAPRTAHETANLPAFSSRPAPGMPRGPACSGRPDLLRLARAREKRIDTALRRRANVLRYTPQQAFPTPQHALCARFECALIQWRGSQQEARRRVFEEHVRGRAALTPQAGQVPPSRLWRKRYATRRDHNAHAKEARRREAFLWSRARGCHADVQRAVLAHGRAFASWHEDRRARLRELARAARAATESEDARAAREGEADEEERLQALRANDMDSYSRLVQRTRNDRLQYLLAETDKYLATLGARVSTLVVAARAAGDQEPAAAAAAAAAAKKVQGEGGGGEEEEALPVGGGQSVQRAYYKAAHRHEEADIRQPVMLVGGVLKEYQRKGLQWMVSLYNSGLNGILADEMGLGKTVQTIALLAHLVEAKQNYGPFLVVVPLSTLSNWSNEFARWAPALTVVLYKGGPAHRKMLARRFLVAGRFNVALTTYEYVMRDKAVLKRWAWEYIVVDEGHRMKNANSKFSLTLGQEYTSRHRLLLTGTPLQNSLPELWALLNFLLPSIFTSADSFEQWFSKPFQNFSAGSVGGEGFGAGARSAAAAAPSANPLQVAQLGVEEKLLVINRLHQVLRPFLLRRVKSEVLGQLPDKSERVLRCRISAWQRVVYRQLRDHGAYMVQDGGGSSAKGLANVLMQLRKVCNHPYLFRGDAWPVDETLVRCAGKFELLDRVLPKLKAAGHRVLIFSQMTQVMDILCHYFELRRHRYLRLDGHTAASEREQRMHMFNASDSPFFVFLLSTRAGGLGINLASADTVIIFDSDWNPQMDLQAQDRAHRIGQRNEVRVFRLVTKTGIEERILSRANEKLSMEGMVIQAGGFDRSTSASERKRLLRDLLTSKDDAGAGSGSGKRGKRSRPKGAASAAAGVADGSVSASSPLPTGPSASPTSVSATGEGERDEGDEEEEEEEEGDENEEEEGLLSPEELNVELARGEEEEALFARIDREHEARRREAWEGEIARLEAAGDAAGATALRRAGPAAPLMNDEEEVPTWVKGSTQQLARSTEAGDAGNPLLMNDQGRSSRRRRAPNYAAAAAAMSDAAFERMLREEAQPDSGGGAAEEPPTKRTRRADAASKAKTEPGGMEEEEEEGQASSRALRLSLGASKRPRPSSSGQGSLRVRLAAGEGEAAARPGAEGGDTEGSALIGLASDHRRKPRAQQPQRRPLRTVATKVPAERRRALAGLLWRAFSAMRTLRGKDDRLLCSEFLQLPDAAALAQHAEKLKKPLAMGGIERRLRDGAYASAQEFASDVGRMLTTFRTVHPRGTQIFRDAGRVQKACDTALQSMEAELCALAGEAAGAAEAVQSSQQQQQQQQPAQGKLRLKLNTQ